MTVRQLASIALCARSSGARSLVASAPNLDALLKNASYSLGISRSCCLLRAAPGAATGGRLVEPENLLRLPARAKGSPTAQRCCFCRCWSAPTTKEAHPPTKAWAIPGRAARWSTKPGCISTVVVLEAEMRCAAGGVDDQAGSNLVVAPHLAPEFGVIARKLPLRGQAG